MYDKMLNDYWSKKLKSEQEMSSDEENEFIESYFEERKTGLKKFERVSDTKNINKGLQ